MPLLSLPRLPWYFIPASLVLLLATEVELLTLLHYNAAPELWDLALPNLKYMALAFCVVSALLLFDRPAERAPAAESNAGLFRISPFFLLCHLLGTAMLSHWMTSLWLFTLGFPLPDLLWFPLLGLYLWVWLACFLDPARALAQARRRWGWAVWAFVVTVVSVPVAHLGDLVWNRWLSQPAMWASFAASRWLLERVYPNVVADPSRWLLGTTAFQAEVRQECAGYQGVRVVTLFALAYLWMRRRELRMPAALWLVPFGAAASWAANCLRIATLVAIATSVSPEIAVDGFHHKAGWLCVVLVGWTLVFLVEKLGCFRRSPPSPQEYAAVPFVLPLAALLFTSVLSRALSGSFDLFYPLRTVIVGLVLVSQLGHLRGHWGKPSLTSVAIGLGVYLLWARLVPAVAQPSPLDVLGYAWGLGWIFFRVAGAVVVIPLVEELAFRGYALRALQARSFEQVPIGRLTPASLILSSLAFGVLHEHPIAGFSAGVAYAWAASRKGRLADAVAAHAVTNLALVLQTLMLHQWGLWS